MEESPIIEIKGVGKCYSINRNRGGYIALRDIITNAVKSPFSFLKKKARQAIGKEKKEEFWALKDVSFNVQRGEVIGVIGKNGAGKSTLLKILSQITPPTTGEISIHGKVGSLLEVGTGFHPELSGRENIFLNGAILGMHRKDIAENFDKIVEFAGIEKFIDTPVKYYSSGMYVRLAFSVAAHMDPDILIVDEVLAVGDAEFQKKCLGKMDEITKTEGRTILFVSHNMAAISSLCKKTVLLEKGEVKMFDDTDVVIAKYLKANENPLEDRDLSKVGKRKGDNNSLQFTSYNVTDMEGKTLKDIPCGSKVKIVLNFKVLCDEISNLRFAVAFKEQSTGVALTALNSYYGINEVLTCKAGNHSYVFTVDHFPLSPAVYTVNFLSTAGPGVLDWIRDSCQITVSDGDFYRSGRVIPNNSQVFFTEFTGGLTK